MSPTPSRYPFESSPFKNLKSIHQLSKLLQVRVGVLKKHSSLYGKFIIGSTPKEGDKDRITETPFGELRRVHERILALFSRIEPPPYLQSGIKKRSYISNAEEHIFGEVIYKLDVKKFFQNTKWNHVFCLFSEQFNCPTDIAAIMANLITVNGHLPTGSPLSTLYAHKRMFDRIYDEAKSRNINMSLYVDDLTFSSFQIDKAFKTIVHDILSRESLEHHKERHLVVANGAEVTGAIVRPGRLRWPQRKHQAAFSFNAILRSAADKDEKIKLFRQLISRLAQGGQLEEAVKTWRKSLKAAKPNILG